VKNPFARTSLHAPRSTLHGLAPLLQLSEDAILVVQPETGQVIEANARAAELTGHTLADLRRLSLGELFAHTVPLSLITQLAPGESRSFRNVLLRTRNGRTVSVDLRLMLPAEGEPVLLLARDLRVSRRLEQALARVEEQLSSVAALIALLTDPALTPDDALKRGLHLIATACGADAVALYQDGGRTTGDGRRTTVPLRAAVGLASMLPPACELEEDATVGDGQRIAGEESAAGGGRRSAVVFGGPHSVHPSAAWAESLQVMGWPVWQALPLPSGCLFIGRRSLGAELGTPALLSAITHATTGLLARIEMEAVRTEETSQARDTEHLTRALLDEVGDGVLVLAADGTLRGCNRTAGRMLGYESHEIAGLAVTDVLIARQDLFDVLSSTLAGASPGARVEVTLLSRDGHEVPALLGGAPLLGPSRGALIIIQDLSQRKAAEDQHRDLDRLAFLGEMSAIFAHEIRNPLAAISTGLQYISGKLPADEALHESMELILAESRRLNQILADILVVARASEPRLAPCGLPDVLEDVLARRTDELDRLGIQVVRNYASDLPSCLGDRSKLEQVFTNLVANAIQAMSSGGTLSVTAKRADQNGSGDAPAGKPGSVIQVEVADTGPGIPEAVQRRIFDPFFTTRRSGTGLGLTIARRIVGQHNGSLSVRSWEGVGTVFMVTLPAVIENASYNSDR